MKMVTELVSLTDLKRELKDMISTCFEGEVSEIGECIKLMLPNGQAFCIDMKEF